MNARPARSTFLLTLGLLGILCAGWFWACRDSGVPYLPSYNRAHWILFPAAPATRLHRAVELETVFRRAFILDSASDPASIEIRAASEFRVVINGIDLPLTSNRNWKDVSRADITGHARTGTNVLEVRVVNQRGPPVLWARIFIGDEEIASDESWESSCAGSAWRPARIASEARLPGPGNLAFDGGSLEALSSAWRIWILFAMGAAAFWLLIEPSLASKFRLPTISQISRPFVILIIVFVLWLALFANNTRALPASVGFDVRDHLEYIEHVQKHWSVPRPEEGFEMFQPPLYYFLSAATLSAFGLSATADSASSILRWMSFLFATGHIAFVFLSLRSMFPTQRTIQVIGIVIAGFLPMHVYISHYVTNETLAASLVALSFYVALRVFRHDRPGVWNCALLGIALGAAVLTKVTAVLIVPVIVLPLAVRLAASRSHFSVWARTFGWMAGAFFALCGWFYFSRWSEYGNPLIGNWDPATGFNWWQDPGFRTAGDYWRFGESLVNPLFSGFAGVLDGLYSTAFADSLCGGAAAVDFRPPWNFDLMIAGLALSVFPVALIVTGACVSLVRLIRSPTAEHVLMTGFASAMVLAILYMSLKVPSYAQAKAFYGLSALVPVAFFAAAGWNVLTRNRIALQSIFGVGLLLWAINSFCSFWIVRDSRPSFLSSGVRLLEQGRFDAAIARFTLILQADSSDAVARRYLAEAFTRAGNAEKGLLEIERALQHRPDDPVFRLQLAKTCAVLGDRGRALTEVREAVRLGPELTEAYYHLSNWQDGFGRHDDAIRAARDGLAVAPGESRLHYALAQALANRKEVNDAAIHFSLAVAIEPDFADARLALGMIRIRQEHYKEGLMELRQSVRHAPNSLRHLGAVAWLLATHPDPQARDGAEAVRLAEQACALTGRRVISLLVTLAAAHAEVGDFHKAQEVIREVMDKADRSGDANVAELSKFLLEQFQQGRSYRDENFLAQ